MEDCQFVAPKPVPPFVRSSGFGELTPLTPPRSANGKRIGLVGKGFGRGAVEASALKDSMNEPWSSATVTWKLKNPARAEDEKQIAIRATVAVSQISRDRLIRHIRWDSSLISRKMYPRKSLSRNPKKARDRLFCRKYSSLPNV
jgi:hypothetical protein